MKHEDNQSLYGSYTTKPTWCKKMIAWSTLILFMTQPILVSAAVIADPNGGQHKPIVDSTASGLPIVQITTPSAAGVSRNFYQTFNVDPKGLILNNSMTIVQTQLAGYITGNPFIGNGAARVILNEVTSSNPSYLRGYTEIAGQKAELVIANPNGITGDGFGFINTSRAILTTGTPIYGGTGSLDAFRVSGGHIAIEGAGMDASTVDQIDLISRSTVINAGIWAKNINMITGANQVNKNTLEAERITGESSAPQVAIDVGLLGGMYGNKIMLVGTENGVGVNNKGTISAKDNNITISSDGKVQLTGSTSATGNVNITAKEGITNEKTLYAGTDIRLASQAEIENRGTLAAGGNTVLTGKSITSTGVLGAGINTDGTLASTGDLTIITSQTVKNRGRNLVAGNLTVNATAIDLASSNTYTGGAANLSATTGDINHNGATLQVDGALTIIAAGAITNDKVSGVAGQITAGQIIMTANSITNQGGAITQSGHAATNLTATQTINNTDGTIATNGDNLSFSSATLDNTRGMIQHAGGGTMSVQPITDLKNNSGTIASNGQMTIGSQTIHNTQGTVKAQKRIDVTANTLNNNQGFLVSNDVIKIIAQGAINNLDTLTGKGIQAGKGLEITAQALNNQNGSITNLDANDLKIAVSQTIQNNTGRIGGNGKVEINAQSLTNQSGQVIAQGDLNIAASQGIDNNRGTLFAQQNLTLNQNTANLNNTQGGIGAGNTLEINSASVDNSGGTLASDKDVQISVQSLTGSGKIIAGRNMALVLGGDYTNDTGSELSANAKLEITVAGDITNRGMLTGVQELTARGTNITNERNGTIAAGNLSITTVGDITNQGRIDGSKVTATSRNFNNSATVVADILTVNAGKILNDGGKAVLGATVQANLYAEIVLENKDDATIYSPGTIIIAGSGNRDRDGRYINRTGAVLNQSASIEAEQNIGIYADQITNKKREFAVEQVQISQTKHSGNINPLPATYRDGSYSKTYQNGTKKYTETVTQTQVTNDSPVARIIAGANMELQATTFVTNDLSHILAGGTQSVVIDGGGAVNNTSVGRRQVTTEDGNAVYSVEHRISHHVQHDEIWHGTESLPYFTQVSQQLPAYAALFGEGRTVVITADKINNITLNPTGAPIGSIATTLPSGHGPAAVQNTGNNTTGATFSVPNGGLYTVHNTPDAKYLVQTDARFTNYQKFISSDYMLQRLNCNPESIQKRLGDGFYEQKLVRDQVIQLTGRQTMEGYTSNEEQYKGLMENGITYAQQYNLQVGVTLTAAQMAQLTSDIVWMEEKQVAGQRVLVPVVYLANAGNVNLHPSGAVISANKVLLNAAENLTNSGQIRGNDDIQINAGIVTNRGGVIDSGGLIKVVAVQDIINQSGTIAGGQVGIVAGRDIINETVVTAINRGNISTTSINQPALIQARQGNASLHADRDIINNGAQLQATQNVTLQAGHNVDLGVVEHIEQKTAASGNFTYESSKTANIVSSVDAGGSVKIVAQKDITLRGTQVKAGADINLLAGGNATVTAVTDRDFEEKKDQGNKYYLHTKTDEQTVVGSSLTAGGNITIAAVELQDSPQAEKRGNILIEGSKLFSNTGNVTAVADKDVTIREVGERHETSTESSYKKSSFLSSTSTTKRDHVVDNLAVDSTISGARVTVQSGNDLTIRGSNVVATNDIIMTAKNNVNITAAQEKYDEEHYYQQKKSGISLAIGGGGISLFAGTKNQQSTSGTQGINHVGSTIGSTEGRVVIGAEKDVRITGSDVIGTAGIDMTAINITIDAATNTGKIKDTYEYQQSGITVSVGSTVINSIGTGADNLKRSGEVEDKRLKALYVYKAVKAYEAVDQDKDAGKDPNKLTVNVSIGSSNQKTETITEITSAQGSSLTSGGNINIVATGSRVKDINDKAIDGDLTIIGSTLEGQNIRLSATRDLNLQSAANTSEINTTTSGKSSGLGVTFSGGALTGVSIDGTKSSGNIDQTSLTHTETKINARETLITQSGRDTNLIGAQASGKQVIVDVGGNLRIESKQDVETYHERNKSTGGHIGVSSSGVTASGSINKAKTDSAYRSVNEQTGIFAGTEGFNIEVQGNTNLKGAVIASEATADKNKISTGTLTYSDIQNKAEYDSSSIGVNYATGKDVAKKDQGLTPNIGVPASGKADSTTKSAVSAGTIIVGGVKVDPANLSRDTTNSLNTLGKIFDKKTVQEQQELTKVFGEEAFKAIGDLADAKLKKAVEDAANNKDKDPAAYQDALKQIALWKTGGENKILLDSLAGGIMSSLGGGSFGSGALSSGLNQVLQGELSKITDPAAHQWASFIVGAVASKILGGDALTGGSITSSQTKNNDLNHDQQIQFAARLTEAIAGQGKTDEEVKQNTKDAIQNWININGQSDPNLKDTDGTTILLLKAAADTLGIKFSYDQNDSLTNNLNTFKEAMDGWQSVPNEYGKLWRVRTLADGTTQINPDDLAQYKKDQAWNQSVSDNLLSKVTMLIGVPGVGTTEVTVVKTADEVSKVFWSGGNVAKGAAEVWARKNGATTLEMTENGVALIEKTSNMPWSEAKPLWSETSRDFAKSASGEVQVFQKMEGVNLESVWATVEYKELMANTNVTKFTYNVIMSDGTTKIFTVVK